jgi:hypothetical protein
MSAVAIHASPQPFYPQFLPPTPKRLPTWLDGPHGVFTCGGFCFFSARRAFAETVHPP